MTRMQMKELEPRQELCVRWLVELRSPNSRGLRASAMAARRRVRNFRDEIRRKNGASRSSRGLFSILPRPRSSWFSSLVISSNVIVAAIAPAEIAEANNVSLRKQGLFTETEHSDSGQENRVF